MIAQIRNQSVNWTSIDTSVEEEEHSAGALRINRNQTEEEIVKTARDLVYAQRWRGTMYLDVIQDMVEWIASSDIRSYAVLGEWSRGQYGYFLPIRLYVGDTIIPVYVYALRSDSGRSSSYTVLIAGELIEFMDLLSHGNPDYEEAQQLRAAIRFGSYVRSRMLRGHCVKSHLLAYATMVGDIWRTAFDRDNNNYYGKLNIARRMAISSVASYGNMAQFGSCYRQEEHSAIGALSESLYYLVEWRNDRRRGKAQ